MQRCTRFLAALVCGFVFTLGFAPDADARRLSGGGSFGGKSAFNTPFKRNAAQPVRSPKQQQAAQQNAQARQQFANRGGFMGMLGGLAIGGLIGALLFGGAFENLNLIDLLLFGALGFALFKLFAARAGGGPRPQPAYAREPVRAASEGFDRRGAFLDDGRPAGASALAAQDTGDADFATLPSDFDPDAFLTGARDAYRALQRAWDAGDLATLRQLCTAPMYAELERRRTGDPPTEPTDVLKVEAELLDAREIEGMQEAVVLFDTVLRESRRERTSQAREVWHFTRPRASERPTWFLDGIQQLED